ncbi:MAG: CoA transferase, partial [Chloroflexi bacterium]|nr:CoA transferase [Chloroflexota bacterium]
PHADERGAVWNVPHPKLGSVPLVASALRHMGRTPATPQSHPPMLGEHTFEVLNEVLGIEESELETLEKDGVISPD